MGQENNCIGCRIRKKKCDRLLPLCSECKKLQVPPELCIYQDLPPNYRSNGPAAIIDKSKQVGQELEKEKQRLEWLLSFARQANHSIETGAYNDNNQDINRICVEGPRTLAHLGSLSLYAVLKRDPATASLLKRYDLAMVSEMKDIDLRIKERTTEKLKPMLGVFEARCKAAAVGIPVPDGDVVIQELVKEAVEHIPEWKIFDYFFASMQFINEYRWIGSRYRDIGLVRIQFEEVFGYDERGKVTCKLRLPEQKDKLITLIWFLMLFAWVFFVRYARKSSTDKLDSPYENLDFIVFNNYVTALLDIDLIGNEIKLGDSMSSHIGVEVLHLRHVLNKYSLLTSYFSGFYDNESTNMDTRVLITRAITQHLHGDLDKHYPQYKKPAKMHLKSLWHNIVLLDCIDCFDSGQLSSIQPKYLYYDTDGAPKEYSDAIRTLHCVIYDYNYMDGQFRNVDDLFNFIENGCVSRLKSQIKSFPHTGSEDLELLYQKRDSLKQYKADNLRGASPPADVYEAFQRAPLRLMHHAVILALYSICLMKLEDIGESKTSLRYMRMKTMAFKHAFTITMFQRDLMNVMDHYAQDKENSGAHMLMIFNIVDHFPYYYCALRRASHFIGCQLSQNYLNGLDPEIINEYVLFSRDRGKYNKRVMSFLGKRGDFNQIYTLKYLENMEYEENPQTLIARFSKFSEWKIIALAYFKTFDDENRAIVKSREVIDLVMLKLSKRFSLGYRLAGLAFNYAYYDEYIQSLLLEKKKRPKYHPLNIRSFNMQSESETEYEEFDNTKNVSPLQAHNIIHNDHHHDDNETSDTDSATSFKGSFQQLFNEVMTSTSGGFDSKSFFGDPYQSENNEEEDGVSNYFLASRFFSG